MKYYTNRELARRFDINLAKWKRWSREFLPPDPLGGLQSGYARQYHRDDAFTLYLGGHLVAELRYAIPEGKRILSDLSPWLAEAGFYENTAIDGSVPERMPGKIQRYHIHIQSQNPSNGHSNGFRYRIRGILSEKEVSVQGAPVQQVQFVETVFASSGVTPTFNDSGAVKLLRITRLYNRFLDQLQAEGSAGTSIP